MQMWQREAFGKKWSLGLRGFFLEMSIWNGQFRKAFESASIRASQDIRPFGGVCRKLTFSSHRAPLSACSSVLASQSTPPDSAQIKALIAAQSKPKDSPDSPPPKKLHIVLPQSQFDYPNGMSVPQSQEMSP